MTRVKNLYLGLAAVLFAGVAQAQTVQEPPRFDGSRSAASSSSAVDSSDPQRAVQSQGGTLSRTLVGEAILEAAREEGRYFIEERRQQATQPGSD
ncbi:hypothetical protein [uncultured Roseobacter sp.]|uniref:hypothetical protein n=1 Tax=uncultured Roseobacter sp. TaxID=114847 RepID=UPI002636CF02|nr:hypothetical protein [uncultured Roseobacter sp.]